MNSPSPLEMTRALKPGVAVIELPADALKSYAQKMPEGVNVLVVPPTEIQPVFIRLPACKKGPDGRLPVCPVTGLPRSSLVDLLKEAGPKVKTHKLRKRGSLGAGQVLIDRQSLVDYISTQEPPDWTRETEAEDGEV